MTVDNVLHEKSERETLIEMVEDLIYLIESADHIEEVYTETFYEIKNKISTI